MYANKNGMNTQPDSKYRFLTERELERYIARDVQLDIGHRAHARSRAVFEMVVGIGVTRDVLPSAEMTAKAHVPANPRSDRVFEGKGSASEQKQEARGSDEQVRDDNSTMIQQRIDACLFEVEQERQFALRKTFIKHVWLRDYVFGHVGISWSPPQRYREPSVPRSTESYLFHQDLIDEVNGAILEKPLREYTREYSPLAPVAPPSVDFESPSSSNGGNGEGSNASNRVEVRGKKRARSVTPEQDRGSKKRRRVASAVSSGKPVRPRYNFRRIKARQERSKA